MRQLFALPVGQHAPDRAGGWSLFAQGNLPLAPLSEPVAAQRLFALAHQRSARCQRRSQISFGLSQLLDLFALQRRFLSRRLADARLFKQRSRHSHP